MNTRDIPGFYLNGTQQALGIIDDVGSKNLWLQYDIYHMQVMEGDLATTLERNLKRIAHIQLADNPGRNDWVMGRIDVHPNGRGQVYDFSCSVNFDSGNVRTAQIESRPSDWDPRWR